MAHVQQREDERGGAFFVEQEGHQVAELTFTKQGPNLVSMDHTFVASKLRGQGIARQMLDAGIAWARQSKTKIVARCEYVKKEFERDPSIRDVRSA